VPRIAAVSFDAGGTLLHMDPPPEVVFAQLSAAVGLEVTPEAAAAAYARAEPWFNAHADLYRQSPDQFWLGGNRALLTALGVTDDLDHRAAFITAEFPRHQTGWRLYPDVMETLAALRRAGLPLAVVSNWDPGLEGLLGRLGVRDAFAAVISSADVGIAKPDPRIFHLAAAALGVSPALAAHVGDLFEYDVVGARAAGMLPVLLERRGAPRASVFAASQGHAYEGPRIGDLRELLPLVERLSGRARAAT
jgi:REG-2-like HAD superfamily hydrolase